MEDFVPILHAPLEKLSKEEREAWNIPACISSWKNTGGCIILLDKRLVADGWGLRDDASGEEGRGEDKGGGAEEVGIEQEGEEGGGLKNDHSISIKFILGTHMGTR